MLGWQALDHVIAEGRRNGIRLLLSLVNNLQAYGGKTQYVKWAWEEGVALSSSNDSFFYDPSIRHYFKTYVKVILLVWRQTWIQLLTVLHHKRSFLLIFSFQIQEYDKYIFLHCTYFSFMSFKSFIAYVSKMESWV